MNVRFLFAGDTGLVVEFGDRADRELSKRVLRLSASVRASKTPGVVETVPTYRSLLVIYDSLRIDSARLISVIKRLIDERRPEAKETKLWRIPVCYESNYAPDLTEVAERTGRGIDEIVRVHAESVFHVYMIGFVPGHPYLGDLPDWIALPRRMEPRVRVPAGSIGISGRMTVIYPLESPGGWHLIGATPIRLFDPVLNRPSLLSPGDKVRFVPITASEFDDIRNAVEQNKYTLSFETIAV